MRPNGEEVLRGVQGALLTYVLPEVQSAYARTELMIALSLLGIVADDWDDAAQRLADDNAALRALARRASDALADDDAIVANLRPLAAEAESSLRLSGLAAANERLRAALGRLAPMLEAAGSPGLRDLRAAVMDHLRADAESRARSLLGPRADG